MKKIGLLLHTLIITVVSLAQPAAPKVDTTWKTLYRATPTKINDLLHTKIVANLDFVKQQLQGKVWLTLQPHFYPTDSLLLDAKGMEIANVSIAKASTLKKINYTYDGMELKIKLDKTYKANEKYTVYVDYTAKPNDYKGTGSEAITDAKGLYFINADGKIKNKPTQLWTQGETEATSVWVPIIDKTNQKTTQEIYMTVPSKYVTLSNGLLVSKKANGNGTRTDYWKMDLPHSPYLFFMGVGDFAIIKGTPYNGKVVDYYVEKDQAPFAKGVFGNTTEMIGFFSKILGVEYPWQKYSQIVGRDYVSGAMENTTATLHQESAYQNMRQLADGNGWESTIAHELFHQWFGDLVTCESWSNLTLNESFADYSEYLWAEYKQGKDAADAENYQAQAGYLQSGGSNKHLVRYYYADKEDMFDQVSYQKGGRILHMLRKYLGDDAFFAGLKNYLTTNKFKNGEASQLRLAMEEVSGKDLNWFFNQWYYGSGHPKLDVVYNYNADKKQVEVAVNQYQKGDKLFTLPVAIDIYDGRKTTRTNVWLSNRNDTIIIPCAYKPTLIDFDGDRTLLCEKKENKTADNYLSQYQYNPNYLARREALDYFAKNKLNTELANGLNDKYSGLRNYTLSKIASIKENASFITAVEQLANTEKDNKTKASALKILAKEKNEKYSNLFTNNINVPSYSLAGAALEGLAALKPNEAYTMAKAQVKDAKGALGTAVNSIITEAGKEEDFDYIEQQVSKGELSQQTVTATKSLITFMTKINDLGKVRKGVDAIAGFKNKIPEKFQGMIMTQMIQALKAVSDKHGDVIKNYIDEKMK